MASTTTTTCDRCGVVISTSRDRSVAPVGFVQVSSQVVYRDTHRASWDLCDPCYQSVVGILIAEVGRPEDEWSAPAGEPEDEV